MFNRIKLKNILSFGPDGMELELKPLNVLIGPNGSGKSNLIEVIGLLQAAPRELTEPIIAGGGVRNWIWRGQPNTPSEPDMASAEVEVALDYQNAVQKLHHRFVFTEHDHRVVLTDERIEGQGGLSFSGDDTQVYFELVHGRKNLSCKKRGGKITIPIIFDHQKSVLAQLRDPVNRPDLTWLGDTYSRIALYREWSFGRSAPFGRSA